MKKLLIILLPLLLLTSCEVAQDWKVTVTTEIQQWDIVGHRLVRTEKSTYTEVVLGISEKQIKEYCVQGIYTETYGNTMYKYITSKSYVPM